MSKQQLLDEATLAIFRAECLTDPQKLVIAYREVSRREELLADEFSASTPHGVLARHGAVLAALKAGDTPRALDLIQRYLADAESPPELRRELERLRETATKGAEP